MRATGGRFGSVMIKGKAGRTCPLCKAAPGNKCGRWNGMQVWTTNARMHKER